MMVREAGYTVVEVTLFLAISGLLFLIAVVGTGSTIRTVRFNDSARSLSAFVQKQYDDIINGLNPRNNTVTCTGGTVTSGAQTPGTSNCLVMGKLLVFRANSAQVTTYPILGTEPSTVNYGDTDSQLVISFQPRVVTAASQIATYNIPWGTAMSGFERIADSQATNGLALIRSPKSSRVLTYTYEVPASVSSDISSVVGNIATNLSKTTNLCFKNADGLGAPAKLVAADSANQNAIDLVFDSNDGECNGT